MKPTIKHYLTVHNKKYAYTIEKIDADTSFVSCESASISQAFLNEDIPALLTDLPNLILAEKSYHDQTSHVIRFRVTLEDKKQIEKLALKKGYQSVSGFLRDVALKSK